MNAQRPFDKTIDRVRGLLALHPTLHGTQGRPKQAVSDLLRGALVLSVAALDGLVLDAVAETIGPAARAGQLGDVATKWTRESPADVLGAFAASDPAAALADLGRERLSVMTFQRAEAIEGVLWDVARCNSPWSGAAARLSGPGDMWDEKRLKDRLDEFVKRRHRIAHGGDLSKSGATEAIQRPYVEEAVRVIEAVGKSVCQGLDKRLRELRRA